MSNEVVTAQAKRRRHVAIFSEVSGIETCRYCNALRENRQSMLGYWYLYGPWRLNGQTAPYCLGRKP